MTLTTAAAIAVNATKTYGAGDGEVRALDLETPAKRLNQLLKATA